MLEPIKVDGFEYILEKFHNLFLGKSNKLGEDIYDLKEDFTL